MSDSACTCDPDTYEPHAPWCGKGREVVTNVQGRIVGVRGGYLKSVGDGYLGKQISDLRALIRVAESNRAEAERRLGDALAEADRRWGTNGAVVADDIAALAESVAQAIYESDRHNRHNAELWSAAPPAARAIYLRNAAAAIEAARAVSSGAKPTS